LVASGVAIDDLSERLDNWHSGISESALEAVAGFSKGVKKSLIVFIASALFIVLIPSKETMYTMLVNQYITVDNIKTAGNTAKEIVDYIFDKVEGIKE
jgi:hypothetical protein